MVKCCFTGSPKRMATVSFPAETSSGRSKMRRQRLELKELIQTVCGTLATRSFIRSECHKHRSIWRLVTVNLAAADTIITFGLNISKTSSMASKIIGKAWIDTHRSIGGPKADPVFMLGDQKMAEIWWA